MGSVKFALFTDLHHDIIPDGTERLNHFLTRAREAEVDFIMELGDFCHPCEKNEELRSLFNGFEKPHYHVIGNHDSDLCTKDEGIHWLGMDNAYYSFECGNVKFIVLDTSFSDHLIPDDELAWLQGEIAESLLPIVIVSHHSLENSFRKRGVSNREEVQRMINQATANGKKILLCLNGHDHTDSIEKINKTYYLTLNSISYKWFGPEFEHFCYSRDIHDNYPYVKDIILHSEPLSAIISIDDQCNIEIEGMEGGYQKITPKELGITGSWDGRVISPHVSSRRLSYE